MSHDVFISYSQHDSDAASEICKVLEDAGIRCWIAPRDVVAGRPWGASIVQAIGASRLVVLVFSARSNTSPQVLREVERATSRNVAVLPYRIEPVELSPELEYYLSVTHWLNAFDDKANNLASLVRTAREILGASELSRPTVSSTPAPEEGSVRPSETGVPERVSADPVRPPQKAVAFASQRVAASPRNEPDAPAIDSALPVGADDAMSPAAPRSDQIWSWIDRFLPAGALVVAVILTLLVGTAGTDVSLGVVWSQLSLPVQVTGFLCPIAAVGLWAGYYRSNSRPIVMVLAALSIAAPFIGLWNTRRGIVREGSVTLGAIALGISETVMTVPFAWAAILALAVLTVPRSPRGRYQATIISLSVLAVICVLTNALMLRELATTRDIASLGIAGWLVRIVSP